MTLLSDHNLVPGEGSERTSGGWIATTTEPWLIVTPVALFADESWIRLRYATSLMDETIRPLIRFTSAAGDIVIEPMNGAILGSAAWLGQVPENTVEVAICPSRRLGPFGFRLESIVRESTTRLLCRGFFRSKLWTYWTLRCLFFGAKREAWQALRSATEGVRFSDYAAWHARNSREPDFEGFDASRFEHADGPRFTVFIPAEAGHASAMKHTQESLTAQTYRRFSIQTVDPQAPDTMFSGTGKPHKTPWGSDDWIVVLKAGERLRPSALALVAEKIMETPTLDAIYTDEDCITAGGVLHSPRLKPDWSPILQATLGYVERGCFVRVAAIPADLITTRSLSGPFTRDALKALPSERIHHLRRILVCRQHPIEHEMPAVAKPPAVESIDRWPSVSIIIPIRDRVELLASCLKGLEERTKYDGLNIVIVDNGSSSHETLAFLDALAAPKYRIVRDPGTFNYSRLCNVGARASDGDVLIFLNNDTEVREDADWLRALVRFAILPKVGAVGAKLFFANGRIQHAGVVLGLSGIAGHPYLHKADLERRDGRWSNAPHEVSAVTGACLAVQRSKFDAVDGFDEHLAVDLNDIDLCLRLAVRGWTNVWSPSAQLTHHESSSRGIARNYFEVYSAEIACFQQRWKDLIRDDPYFNPALSLYAYDIALA